MGPTGPTGPAGQPDCFVAGTLLRTPEGERPVESLAAGDAVVTAEGAVMTVRWVGRRRLRLGAHPEPRRVQPIRVSAGAFGDGLPARDLFVSPGHGLFAEDRLIPAGCLVNGRTITQVAWAEVDYWHVELDRHEILLAEGLPSESYLDCGNRGEFEGQDGPVALHPTFSALSHEAARAPFLIAGPLLEAVKARLARRADRMERADGLGAALRRMLRLRA